MPELIAARRNGNHVANRPICHGCGLDTRTDGQHRPDCTVQPSPLFCAEPDCDAIRLPSERGPQPWQYRPNTREYFCPDHRKGVSAC